MSAQVTHEEKHPRLSLRRRSGISYAGMLISAVFFLPTVAYWNSVPLIDNLWSASAGTAMFSACILLGSVARFVVTPQSLHVDTAFRRVTIPRHLLGEFVQYGPLIRARLIDGERVTFRVDSPLWDSGTNWSRRNDRTQDRTTTQILAMFERVPADGVGTATVTRTWRPVTTVFGILVALTAIPVNIIATVEILWH